MRANNLHGDYCQTCASILDDVQRNFRRVIVLDAQCAAVYAQSGDGARLDEGLSKIVSQSEAVQDGLAHAEPEIPTHKHKAETMEHKEAVNVSPKEAALRTTPHAKHRQKKPTVRR